MRCLDARLCDMHGEGSRHEVNMRRTVLRSLYFAPILFATPGDQTLKLPNLLQ